MFIWEQKAPISYAWRVKAPTLIMSDVGDWRVTTTQAYKLFHALKDNWGDAEVCGVSGDGAFAIWRSWSEG